MARRSLSTSSERSSSPSVTSDEDTNSSANNIEPPAYTAVLLENHLHRSVKHVSLFPPELILAIRSLLLHPLEPPGDPRSTFHTLNRSFPEGTGSYVGEVDYKLRRHGYGHMVYASGDQYQGQWRKGFREGRGAYLWAESGSVFAGSWCGNEMNGEGHFVKRRGEECVVYTGVWCKGRIRGRVSANFVNEHGRVEMAEEELKLQEDEGDSLIQTVVPGRKNDFRSLLRRMKIK